MELQSILPLSLIVVLFSNVNLGGAQDLEYHIQQQPHDPPSAAGFYTPSKRFQFKVQSNATQIQLQFLSSKSGQPGRYNYRLVLGSWDGNITSALFKFNSLQGPILPNNGQPAETGSYNNAQSTVYVVDWSEGFRLTADGRDVFPSTNLHEADLDFLDYVNIDLGKYGETDESAAYSEWCIARLPGSSFWMKPSVIGEYRMRLDVDPSPYSISFFIRACVGARVAMFFDDEEEWVYEIVFGDTDDENPVVYVQDSTGLVVKQATTVATSCFDFRSFTLTWEALGASLTTTVSVGEKDLWSGLPFNGKSLTRLGFSRGNGTLNGADFFFGNIQDLRAAFMTDLRVLPDGYRDVYISYSYPVISTTKVTAILDSHDKTLTFGLYTAKEIQIELSSSGQKIVFTLGQGTGKVKVNDGVEEIKNMSQLFRPGKITQFELEFVMNVVVALVPVDSTVTEDALSSPEQFGLDLDPLVVSVDALGDPDAVIIVDQIPVHEVHFTTTPQDPEKLTKAAVFLADHVIFRVSSAAVVKICLCTQVEGCDWNRQFMISITGNSVSIEDTNTLEKGSFTMKETLTDKVQMTFWIRWTDGVAIGRGSNVLLNELLRVEGEPVSVWAAAFHSDNTATWSVIRSNANAVTLNPMITSHVEVHRPANSFQVSTLCPQFTIASENRPLHGENIGETIPLIIDTSSTVGRHGRCDVIRGDQSSASLSLSHPEGSLDLRRYWVSWEDKDMLVGQGTPMGLTALMAPEPPILGAQIVEKVSFDPDADLLCGSSWVLPPNGGGKSLVTDVHSPPGDFELGSFNWMAVTEETSKVFAGATCGTVQLITTVFRGLFDETNHVIVFGEDLGDDVGLAVTIRKGFQTDQKPDFFGLMDPFDCSQPRYHWVSWHGGQIQAGLGQHIGHNSKVTMPLVEGGEKIGALGFRLSKTEDVISSWAFPEELGSRFEVMTFGDGKRKPEVMVFHDTFAFRVRSCGQAILRLSRSYNGALEDDLEVVLNPQYGPHSVLRLVDEMLVLDTADLGGRLSCTDYADFWISIGTDKIGLGMGEWYTVPLLEATVTDANNYRFLQLTSMGMAQWSYTDNAALVNRFHTPVDGRLDHVMYRKHDAEAFVFRVKACTGIMIGLYGPAYGELGYFITLGGGSGMDRWNGISRSKGLEPEIKFINDRWPATVQCESYADFWVAWDNQRVAAGEGRTVGVTVLAELSTDADPLVYDVGLGMLAPLPGSTMVEAEWEIINIPDGAYVYDTTVLPSRDHYVSLPTMVSSYSFRLRTCGTGVLYLYPQGSSEYQYIVKIGPESTITKKGAFTPSATYALPVTDCKRDAEFLLDWSAGKLALKLKLTSGEWFEFLNDGATVTALPDIAMGTEGPERTYWTLPPMEGTSLYYGGNAGPLWNMLPYQDHVILNAKGNDEVKVTLAAVPGITSQDVYVITIRNQNPCRLSFNGLVVDSFSFATTNTLTASKYFTFWVSWKGGVVEVGSGSSVGLGRFLGWRNSSPTPVRGLTVNTAVFWRFDAESEPSYQVTTPTGSDHTDGPTVWLGDLKRFHFRVQASEDARLILAGSGAPLEIVLGDASNSKIAVVDETGAELNSTMGQFLSENVANAFWIDWTDDLELGLGYTYGYQTVLTIPLPMDVVIDRVQMYSPFHDDEGSYAAVWNWGSVQGVGVEYPLYINDHPNAVVKYEWRDVYDDHVVFQVLGCEDISIVLGSAKLHPEALPSFIQGINIVLTRDGNPSPCDASFLTCIPFQWGVTLGCKDYQTYWLKWTADLTSVTLGFGAILSEDVILNQPVALANHFDVTAIGFRNPTQEKMHFRFLNVSGNAIRMVTQQDSAGIPLTIAPFPAVTTQVWNVHSCGPVKVGFWESYGTAQTKSTIRSATHLLTIDDDQGYIIDSESIQHPVVGLLGCSNPRRMYADWANNQLRAGTLSNDGQYELTQYAQVKFGPFSAVSFASPDTNTLSVWDITQMPGDYTTLKIKGGSSGYKGTYLGVSGIKRIYFKVKSASTVHLAICEIPGITTSRAYELIIELEQITLKSSVGGQQVGTATSKNLLSADTFHEYWIEWGSQLDGSRMIAIGRRDGNQDASFIDSIPFNLTDINALSAKTLGISEMSLEFFTPISTPMPPTTTRPTTPTRTPVTSVAPEGPTGTVTEGEGGVTVHDKTKSSSAPAPPTTTPTTTTVRTNPTTKKPSPTLPQVHTTETNENHTVAEIKDSPPGGLGAGTVVGIVAALFAVAVVAILLYAYRDTWLPMLGSRDPDVRHLVQYNAKDEENGVVVDAMDPHLSFPDLDSQPTS